MSRTSVDERGFEAVRRIREKYSDEPLSAFKATLREQFFMLLIDPEGALSAIPSLLPADPNLRRKAFDLITQVLNARGGSGDAAERERIQRISRLFDVDDRLKRVKNVPVAPENQVEKPAKTSQTATKAAK
jgi:hypothetical protein